MQSAGIEPHIIFEDTGLIVLSKPSGLIVNKSDTTIHEVTVQDWIEKKFEFQVSKLKIDKESDFYKRSGIVHRLDKETSGILLIAKTQTAFDNLQKQFKERIVEKEYRALVHGNLLPNKGEINVPVGRLEYNRKRFGIVAGGREAVTMYKTIATYTARSTHEQLSLLTIYPKTGRTHQIRVHLKYLNHPVFSDVLYGGRKTSRNDRKLLSRLFLHAAKISFLHPVTGQMMTFESPLPEALQEFLDNLIRIDTI